MSQPTQSQAFHPICSLASLACLGLALAGCGGGGGAPGSSDPTSSSTATVVAGVYAREDSQPYFWAAAVKNTGSSPETYEFYALNYGTDPAATAISVPVTLYSGTLTPGVNGAAAFSGKALRPGAAGGNAVASQATLSATSASALNAELDAGTTHALTQSGSAKTGLDAAAGLAFTGRWVDGDASARNLSLTVAATGVASSFNVLGCTGVQLRAESFVAASGVYRVKVTYPTQTGCARSGQELNGLASVHAIGAVRRLHLVAVAANGQGVSFRGDRP